MPGDKSKILPTDFVKLQFSNVEESFDLSGLFSAVGDQ